MMRRWGALFFGVAVGAFVLLLLWPNTAWLVRMQLRTAVGWPLPMLDEKRLDTRLASYTERHPDDYEAQLVRALGAADSSRKVENLRALMPQFGDRPSLPAHLLRFLCQGKVRLNRDEELLMAPPVPAGSPARKSQMSRPEDLALFVETARRGQSLDPDNAYFPTMEAIGLFAQHQDAAATDALNRAVARPKWEEYSTEEAEARWRVAVAANGGEIGSLSRTAIAASILLPHYAVMRGMARVAVGSAVLLEQQGKAAEALVLRQAVARIGAKLRVESRTIIGSLVGIAITAIAAARPGGEAMITQKETPDGNLRHDQMVARYAAYLNQIGQPEEAAWYTAEAAKGREAKALSQQASSEWSFGLYPIIGIGGRWLVGYLFLLGVIGTLLLGGGAASLSRTTRIREGLPLASETAWGIGSAASLLVLLTILCAFGGEWKWFGILPCLLVCYAPALVFLRTRKRSEGIAFRRTLAGLLAPSIVLLPCTAITFLLGYIICQSVSSGTSLLQSFASSDSSTGQETARRLLMAQLTDLPLIAPLLLLPALTIVGLVLSSVRRRMPVSVGLARGFRAAALPLAAILLLGFAALTVGTAHREAETLTRLTDMVSHEGPFYSKLTGKPWPGYVADGRQSGIK